MPSSSPSRFWPQPWRLEAALLGWSSCRAAGSVRVVGIRVATQLGRSGFMQAGERPQRRQALGTQPPGGRDPRSYPHTSQGSEVALLRFPQEQPIWAPSGAWNPQPLSLTTQTGPLSTGGDTVVPTPGGHSWAFSAAKGQPGSSCKLPPPTPHAHAHL